MKLIHTIFILIITYLICCAKTCSEEEDSALRNEKESISELRDSIKQIFDTRIPDYQQLRAFEVTAMQKLVEFSDYLKIVSDSSLDLRLRIQAAEMIKALFISDEVDVRYWNKTFQDSDIHTLDQLIGISLSQGLSCWIRPYQINISMPLALGNDTTIAGRLSFKRECVPFNNQDKEKNIRGICVIDIYALKKVKFFGEDSLYVWEVYLGGIN
jgi:hypothetical protein